MRRLLFPLPEGEYVLSVVGTSRGDVRAACSGATPSIASVARIFVPPATTRAGTARRAIPTIGLNTYLGRRRPGPDGWWLYQVRPHLAVVVDTRALQVSFWYESAG